MVRHTHYWYSVLFLCLTAIAPLRAATKPATTGGAQCATDGAALGAPGPTLFKIGEDFTFKGLTPEGKKAVLAARGQLLENDQIGKENLFEMDSFINVLRLAQLGRWNIAALGEGGGSKTGLFDTMIPDLWMKQVHEMMNEVPLIGGQTEAGAQAGREEINTTGTIVDARYAMIDEGQNANPATMLVLQSLLNERMVTINGQKVPAKKLRTIVYTGNADRPGIVQHFADRGTPFSGAPFLNRFQFKFRVPNWLRPENQAKLDAMVAMKKRLHAIGSPEALTHAALRKPGDIDMETLERFAHVAFETTPEFDVVVRDLTEVMKRETEKAIRTSEDNHKSDPKQFPHVLTPSADYTTRLRTQIPIIIKMSAALDFLRSPLSTPENIDKHLKEPIKLGPLSAWRAWTVLTTVGRDRVIFNPFTQEIHFGATINPRGKLVPQNLPAEMEAAKSAALALELQELQEEQDRFKTAMTNGWKILHGANEEAAQVGGRRGKGDEEFEPKDFEFMLANAGGTDVMKVELKK